MDAQACFVHVASHDLYRSLLYMLRRHPWDLGYLVLLNLVGPLQDVTKKLHVSFPANSMGSVFCLQEQPGKWSLHK
ncbi:hypothetical protein FKM82_028906 [Ascaphus truei]